MKAEREGRVELRRALLDRIVALQLEVQTSGDPEARLLLEEARDALAEFDRESLRLFIKKSAERGDDAMTPAQRQEQDRCLKAS